MSKAVCDFFIAFLMSGLSSWILKAYLETFLENKKLDWLGKVRWGFFAIWQVCTILGIIKYPDYFILLLNMLVVFSVTINYEGCLFKKIVFTAVYNSIWLLMEVLVFFIFIVVELNYVIHGLLGSLLSKVFLLMLVEALRHFFCNEKIKELPHSYNMILVLFPLGSMLVVYTSFLMSSQSKNLMHIFWSFASLAIMFLMNILIFTIYLKLSKDMELRQKNVVYKQEIDFYNKHIEEKENSMLEFRKAKHDLKNQLVFMLERCEKKEYHELEQFLEQLIEKAPFDRLTISKTENSVVDALINHKYSVAKRFGIEFTVKLDIPMCLPFDNADMCIILGNALDNALEANIRTDTENHYIKLAMRMDNGNLLIIIENSFDGHIIKDKKGKILTTKTNNINHGLGLDSIQKAVNKYCGFMKTSFIENVFSIEILLYSE